MEPVKSSIQIMIQSCKKHAGKTLILTVGTTSLVSSHSTATKLANLKSPRTKQHFQKSFLPTH